MPLKQMRWCDSRSRTRSARTSARVIFRVDDVTWIDAIVRYLVPPRESGQIKSRLIPKLLTALNAAPEKVMFPKGDVR